MDTILLLNTTQIVFAFALIIFCLFRLYDVVDLYRVVKRRRLKKRSNDFVFFPYLVRRETVFESFSKQYTLRKKAIQIMLVEAHYKKLVKETEKARKEAKKKEKNIWSLDEGKEPQRGPSPEDYDHSDISSRRSSASLKVKPDFLMKNESKMSPSKKLKSSSSLHTSSDFSPLSSSENLSMNGSTLDVNSLKFNDQIKGKQSVRGEGSPVKSDDSIVSTSIWGLVLPCCLSTSQCTAERYRRLNNGANAKSSSTPSMVTPLVHINKALDEKDPFSRKGVLTSPKSYHPNQTSRVGLQTRISLVDRIRRQNNDGASLFSSCVFSNKISRDTSNAAGLMGTGDFTLEAAASQEYIAPLFRVAAEPTPDCSYASDELSSRFSGAPSYFISYVFGGDVNSLLHSLSTHTTKAFCFDAHKNEDESCGLTLGEHQKRNENAGLLCFFSENEYQRALERSLNPSMTFSRFRPLFSYGISDAEDDYLGSSRPECWGMDEDQTSVFSLFPSVQQGLGTQVPRDGATSDPSNQFNSCRDEITEAMNSLGSLNFKSGQESGREGEQEKTQDPNAKERGPTRDAEEEEEPSEKHESPLVQPVQNNENAGSFVKYLQTLKEVDPKTSQALGGLEASREAAVLIDHNPLLNLVGESLDAKADEEDEEANNNESTDSRIAVLGKDHLVGLYVRQPEDSFYTSAVSSYQLHFRRSYMIDKNSQLSAAHTTLSRSRGDQEIVSRLFMEPSFTSLTTSYKRWRDNKVRLLTLLMEAFMRQTSMLPGEESSTGYVRQQSLNFETGELQSDPSSAHLSETVPDSALFEKKDLWLWRWFPFNGNSKRKKYCREALEQIEDPSLRATLPVSVVLLHRLSTIPVGLLPDPVKWVRNKNEQEFRETFSVTGDFILMIYHAFLRLYDVLMGLCKKWGFLGKFERASSACENLDEIIFVPNSDLTPTTIPLKSDRTKERETKDTTKNSIFQSILLECPYMSAISLLYGGCPADTLTAAREAIESLSRKRSYRPFCVEADSSATALPHPPPSETLRTTTKESYCGSIHSSAFSGTNTRVSRDMMHYIGSTVGLSVPVSLQYMRIGVHLYKVTVVQDKSMICFQEKRRIHSPLWGQAFSPLAQSETESTTGSSAGDDVRSTFSGSSSGRKTRRKRKKRTAASVLPFSKMMFSMNFRDDGTQKAVHFCVRCSTELASVIFLPCGHLSLCSLCASTQGTCHECSTPISSIIELSGVH